MEVCSLPVLFPLGSLGITVIFNQFLKIRISSTLIESCVLSQGREFFPALLSSQQPFSSGLGLEPHSTQQKPSKRWNLPTLEEGVT